MPSLVVVEGDLDRALVQALSMNVPVKRPERDAAAGREGAMRVAAIALKQIGKHRVVLLLDRNGMSCDAVRQDVENVLRDEWKENLQSSGEWYLHGESRLRIALAGLPDDEELRSLNISRFSSDDYVFRLCLEDESLQAFCAGENGLSWVPPHAVALRGTILDVMQALQAKGIRFDSPKRYLDLIRAILGFRASQAAFAGNLVGRASIGLRERILGGLSRDLMNDPPA